MTTWENVVGACLGCNIRKGGRTPHEARMKLAAQGLPQSDALGVEMIQKDTGFGTSQFMELGYHIYIMSTQSSDVDATRPIQYATTFVLLLLTFSLNFSAIFLRWHMRRRAIR